MMLKAIMITEKSLKAILNVVTSLGLNNCVMTILSVKKDQGSDLYDEKIKTQADKITGIPQPDKFERWCIYLILPVVKPKACD